MKAKQTSFLPTLDPRRTDYGGGKEKGKRKTSRPFSTKLAMHVTFRASPAKGKYSFLTPRNKHLINLALERYAEIYRIKIYRIKIYRFQNVGNHLHLLLKTKSKIHFQARKDLANFLRRFSGEVSMKVTGSKKGTPFSNNAERGFWDELVYSRLISWGREFEYLKTYLLKNLFEAHGLWDRKKYPDWEIVTIDADTS